MIAEYDGAGNLLSEYVYANGQRIAKMDPDGTMDYYLNDHLGSARAMAGSGWSANYYPFGEIASQTGSEEDTHFDFTGQERDRETGLMYFGARYYNPAIGRWLSVDPLMQKYPSLSPYAYAANNPMRYIDPDGRGVLDGLDFAMALLDFSLTHPQAAQEIGEIFEVGFSAGGQIGAGGEIGPVKAEFSGQIAGEGVLNLAGDANTFVKGGGKAIVEVAGLMEAGIEANVKLDDGKLEGKLDPKFGPKDFDVKKDLKVGGSVKAIAIGIKAKINVGEAVDAAVKGAMHFYQEINRFFKTVENIKPNKDNENEN